MDDDEFDEFMVTAARSGITFRVSADDTILSALQSHGIDVPSSCEQGVCGTCLTRVIEGEPAHRDMYQTNEEHAANTHIAVCCSRSKSATLVLDL